MLEAPGIGDEPLRHSYLIELRDVSFFYGLRPHITRSLFEGLGLAMVLVSLI